MDHYSVQDRVGRLIAGFKDQIPPERVQGMLGLVQAGEHPMALENLLTNLCDLEIALSPEAWAEAQCLHAALRLDPSYLVGLEVEDESDHSRG